MIEADAAIVIAAAVSRAFRNLSERSVIVNSPLVQIIRGTAVSHRPSGGGWKTVLAGAAPCELARLALCVVGRPYENREGRGHRGRAETKTAMWSAETQVLMTSYNIL